MAAKNSEKKDEKLTVRKADMAGVQTLVNQLQQQAGEGEIDANLIDQIASAVGVAVDQAGDAHDEADLAGATGAQMGMDVSGAPEAPTPTPQQEDPVQKAEKVFATRPPMESYVPGAYQDEIRTMLPQFMKALDSGSLSKAQQMVGKSQGAFDEALNMAARARLTEMGIHSANLRKIHYGAGNVDPNDPEALQKAITSGNLAGVNLIPLARLLMPVYAGLRRRIPVNTPQAASDKATWRAYLGFQNLVAANGFRVAEAAVGDAMNETPVEFSAYYRDITLNDAVTLKATFTGRGYDDPMQVAVIRTLTALLQIEEKRLLGDNAAAISAPGKPTCAAAGTGTVGNASSVFKISALTYEGWLRGAAGRADAGSVTGETAGGTASDAIDLSAKESVTITWDAVPGAVAYNIYYKAGGAAYVFIGQTKLTSVTLTSLATVSANIPPSADGTVNALGFEGLIGWTEKSTVYSQSIYGKQAITDLGGAGLTAQASGIQEFDEVLANLWTNWQIAPSAMVMSPLMAGYVAEKLMALNSGNMYRIEVSSERGNIQGGAWVSGYVNRFAPYADGTPRFLDVIPHPYMTDSSILFLSETVPYPMSREARGFAMEPLIPYMYFPLAATSLQFPFAMTTSETLLCFHPSAQTALAGVKMG